MESPPTAPTQRKRWSRGRRILFTLFLIGAFSGLAVMAVFMLVYGSIAARYDLTKLGEMRQRSIVYDVKGRELGRLHGENRVLVPLDKISPWFIKALLIREDARFYEHGGVDYKGVARALYRDIKERKMVQGASTLTMQLARNSFDDMNSKTAHRKLVEVMLARRIEDVKTKDEILELYANRIFFGTGLYGIERASKAYFAKPAEALTLSESAMLVGIIRSPNRFSPFRNLNGATAERDTVLDRMILKGVITAEEGAAAKSEEVIIAARPVIQAQESYVMDAVRRDLDLVLDDQDVEDGGLRIYTTIDSDLQTAAESSVAARLTEVEKLRAYKHITKAVYDAQPQPEEGPSSVPYLQGAALAINNKTGGILAVVGGRDYLQSRFNRAMQGTRPIGSTVKPFIYSAAFLHGLLPGSYLEDAPIREGELADTDVHWSPNNSDGKFLGWQPAEVGLVRSRNAMTVRAGNLAGLDNVIGLLKEAGLGDPQVRTPQIYIGNMGVSLRNLTSAMTVYPNNGLRRRPFIIDRIEDGEGGTVYATPVLESEVMPPGVAQVTKRLMQKVMTQGTGVPARKEYGFKGVAGGKTGTTNDYKDAWFVGYTNEVTCGVWVGLDTPETIISGGYGAKLSLPIWADIMNKAEALDYKTTVPIAQPVDAQVHLCRVSGQLATDGCSHAGTAYQDELPYELVPQGFCSVHAGGAPAHVAGPEAREEPGFFRRLFRWGR